MSDLLPPAVVSGVESASATKMPFRVPSFRIVTREISKTRIEEAKMSFLVDFVFWQREREMSWKQYSNHHHSRLFSLPQYSDRLVSIAPVCLSP